MWQLVLELLVLLFVANGAPILAARALRSAADWPVDLGTVLADGNPLFGNSKTWRGLLASLIATVVVAPLLGFTAVFGLAFSALVMAGQHATHQLLHPRYAMALITTAMNSRMSSTQNWAHRAM